MFNRVESAEARLTVQLQALLADLHTARRIQQGVCLVGIVCTPMLQAWLLIYIMLRVGVIASRW